MVANHEADSSSLSWHAIHAEPPLARVRLEQNGRVALS